MIPDLTARGLILQEISIGDAHLPMKWELPLQEDLGMVHRAGRVLCRCGWCCLVKSCERFGSALAASVRLI